VFRRLFLALLGAVLAAGFLVSVPSAATAATAGPSSFKVVPKSGVRNDSLRLQWTWKAKVDSYQLQVSTSATFASGVTTVTVKGKKNRPSKSLMAATVSPLRNATAYHARVRSKSGSTYSAWTSVVRTATKVRTPDKITSVGHSRKLHSRIPGSSLLECEGAGHMVLLEHHKQVTAELDDLLSLAQGQVPL
jgi:pimeloyl-ACP methyl ester carboxylesterase